MRQREACNDRRVAPRGDESAPDQADETGADRDLVRRHGQATEQVARDAERDRLVQPAGDQPQVPAQELREDRVLGPEAARLVNDDDRGAARPGSTRRIDPIGGNDGLRGNIDMGALACLAHGHVRRNDHRQRNAPVDDGEGAGLRHPRPLLDGALRARQTGDARRRSRHRVGGGADDHGERTLVGGHAGLKISETAHLVRRCRRVRESGSFARACVGASVPWASRISSPSST